MPTTGNLLGDITFAINGLFMAAVLITQTLRIVKNPVSRKVNEYVLLLAAFAYTAGQISFWSGLVAYPVVFLYVLRPAIMLIFATLFVWVRGMYHEYR